MVFVFPGLRGEKFLKSRDRRTRKESRGIRIKILFAYPAPLLLNKDACLKFKDAFS